MIKKFSITFIKIFPFILASCICIKGFGSFFITSFILPEAIDCIMRITVYISLVILSFSFNFCSYHRLILYCIILDDLLSTVLCILGYDKYMLYGPFIQFYIIIIIIIISFFYLKKKYKSKV